MICFEKKLLAFEVQERRGLDVIRAIMVEKGVEEIRLGVELMVYGCQHSVSDYEVDILDTGDYRVEG